MSHAAIRDGLVALLQGVPNVGHFFDRERYVRDESKFMALYLYTPPGGHKQVRGWWLRRKATQERTVGLDLNMEMHTWMVRGYMALNDDAATELEFDALIETMRNAWRANPTLGGICQQSPVEGDNTDGLQVLDVSPVLFCGVLCHSAWLELRTWNFL